jgi:hypothetical protein
LAAVIMSELEPSGATLAVGSLEGVLPHQPQDPAFGCSNSLEPEPRPDLAIAFSMERGRQEDCPDLGNQVGIGQGATRATTSERDRRGPTAVEPGPGPSPPPRGSLPPMGCLKKR